MRERPGFNFLLGLAVIYLIYRLNEAGLIFNLVAYSLDVPVVRGPGELLADFLVEVIKTVGYVSGLAVAGVWDILMLIGSFLGDFTGTLRSRLGEAKTEPVASPEAKPDQVAVSAPVSTGDPEEDAITLLSQQVVYLADEIKSLKGATSGN